jgi:hypothetical protein
VRRQKSVTALPAGVPESRGEHNRRRQKTSPPGPLHTPRAQRVGPKGQPFPQPGPAGRETSPSRRSSAQRANNSSSSPHGFRKTVVMGR